MCVNVEDRDVGFSKSACVYGSPRENLCVMSLPFLRSRSEAQGTRSAKQMLLVFFFVFFSVLLWIFFEFTFFDLACSLKPLFLAR
jgi:hypothetical protein